MLRSIHQLYRYTLTIIILKINKIYFGNKPLFISGYPIIRNYGKIIIGNNFHVNSLQFKTEIYCGKNAKLKIGNNVFINRGVSISSVFSVEIGDNCLIADMVSIQDSNWHEVEENQGIKVKKVIIGKNVWIGKNVIILPGVNIGDHCVIAAGSIITKNIPAKSKVYQELNTSIKKINCSDEYIRS